MQSEAIKKCSKDSLLLDKETKSSAVKKMRFYRDRKWADNASNLTASQLLDEIQEFGSCPLFDRKWSSNHYNFTHALHLFTKMSSIMPMFSFSSHSISSTSTILALEPEPRALAMLSLFLYDNKQEKSAAVKQMEKVILSQLKYVIKKSGRRSKFSRKYTTQQAKNYMKIDMHFYHAIQNFSINSPPEHEQDRYGAFLTFNLTNIEKIRFNELEELLPLFGKDYFLETPYVLPELRDYLSTNPYIYVTNKQFFVEMNNYYSKLDVETMANYLCIKYIDYMIGYTGFDVTQSFDAEVRRELKKLPHADLQTEKHDMLSDYFPLVDDHLYVEQCVDKEALAETQKMVGQVRWAAQKMINEADWLDSKTKEVAIHKLHAMKQSIGASNISLDIHQLDKYYENLNYSPHDSARELDVKTTLFNRQKDLLKCAKPELYDDLAEEYRASTVNSVYSHENNAFTILGAYINSTQFYKSNVPAHVKFGALGSVIGHEIFHCYETGWISYHVAFTLMRTEIEATGLIRNLWKTFTVVPNALLISIQQSKIPEVGAHLNGTRTFRENLPDHTGVRASYYAIKHFNDTWNSTAAEQTDYTQDQLFFMSFGALWCGRDSAEEKLYTMIEDTHSPNQYRINEVLKNVPEFSVAFNCPVGSKMNPQKKCKIW
ncbi:Phosphate-regulating neutral endopeptidase [Aphelenchoides bicaudatus]|nr:Phosphate-regulating neutral endopeptidase [Aphelenchoides bicaudatus]